MANNDMLSHDSSAIDAILRGLTNRPNVHSTLILSRKDGSIIKATGFKELRNQRSSVRQDYTESDSRGQDTQELDETSTNSQRVEPHSGNQLTSAEVLASSIHSFVEAAVGLTSNMSLSDNIGEAYQNQAAEALGRTQAGERALTNSDSMTEQDLQLLRLRTKKQEIIIFPDRNYICCVVQNIGKATAYENGK